MMDRDPQGPLCDLLQMLLCALFNLQEEEAEEYLELEKEEKEELEKAKHAGTVKKKNFNFLITFCYLFLANTHSLCFSPSFSITHTFNYFLSISLSLPH